MANYGEFQIEPNRLRAMARQLDEYCADTQKSINNADQQIQTLRQSGFQSNAGERLRQRFEALRNKVLSTYPESMTAYARFLRDTADKYEAADETERQRINTMMGAADWLNQ